MVLVSMTRFILLINTVRYLKLKQLYHQVRYRLSKPRPPRGLAVALRGAVSAWPDNSYYEPSTTDGINYTFLGRKSSLGGDWNSLSHSKLWLYNLHYQDSLNAKGATGRLELGKLLIDDWIAGNPPPKGNGWEPYCLSLRVVNWIKFFSRLEECSLKPKWIESLAVQVSVLEKRLEYHILANHLFANAKALVFAGVFFGGEKGNYWLKKGLKLLDVEIREQFLDDGAHYELSPMYQAILLWDIADLLMLRKICSLPQLELHAPLWQRVLAKGILWQRAMVHPDREISFFNDATFGVGPSLDDLERYAELVDIIVPFAPQVKELSAHLMQPSGFGIIDWPDGHRLLADVAYIGPDYQPGHAHADTLSCELSLFGHRVLVNSGISEYSGGPYRDWQRSTAAHNTVEINGESSSEVWAGFRVARRARPFNVRLLVDSDRVRLHGSHNGYQRFREKVTHCRTWSASKKSLVIEDDIKGKHEVAVANWYFHPSIDVLQVEGAVFVLKLRGNVIAKVRVDGGFPVLQDSKWYPGFGRALPNKKLEVKVNGSKLITLIQW